MNKRRGGGGRFGEDYEYEHHFIQRVRPFTWRTQPDDNAPVNPSAEECYRMLSPFAAAAAQACPADGRAMIGVIHHRRGPDAPCVLDQRWLAAVHQAAQEAGIEVLGVLARTAARALIPITDAAAEPA